MDVSIREATPDDAEVLAPVYRGAYQENIKLGFPAKAASVTTEIVSDWIEEHTVFVASIDSEIVGAVRIEEMEPHRAKLSRLGVGEPWKGEGVGSRLLDHVEGFAREHGYTTLCLTTPEDHPYLVKMYRRRGFEQTGDYPLAYRDYDEVVMEKQLPPNEG